MLDKQELTVTLVSLYTLLCWNFNEIVAKERTRVFQIWGDRWCRNPEILPTSQHWVKDLVECASTCYNQANFCKAFGFQPQEGCFLYENPTPSVFSLCSPGMSVISFYIENFLEVERAHLAEAENAALFKPTAMSSVHVWHRWNDRVNPHIPSGDFAVDGNFGYDIFKTDNSIICSVTSPRPLSWWRVDLLAIYVVVEVMIANNDVETYSPLRDIEIRVGPTDIARLPLKRKNSVFKENDLCAVSYDMDLLEGLHYFQCTDPVEGRFVSIQSVVPCSFSSCPRGSFLVLCEVQVWAFPQHPPSTRHNVAYLKPVEMTSVYFKMFGYLATDGMAFPHPTLDQAAATFQHTYPYLWVDLLRFYTVDMVVIVNVFSPLNFRLHDFEVRVSNEPIKKEEPFEKGKLCAASFDTFWPDFFIPFSCLKPLVGRWVTLQIIKKSKLMFNKEEPNTITIAELMVYGVLAELNGEETSAALHKPSMQSSTDGEAVAELAVDGYTAVSQDPGQPVNCARTTGNIKLPWWRVDLQEEFFVKSVVIFGSAGEAGLLHDFEIRVGSLDVATMNPFQAFTGNSLCVAVVDSNNTRLHEGRNHLDCDEVVLGRFLSIQIVKRCQSANYCQLSNVNILSLCEVMVTGNRIRYKDQGYELVGNQTFWDFAKESKMPIVQAGPVKQSSSWFPAVGPEVAVDGDWNLRLKYNDVYKCTYSQPKSRVDSFPWWQLDLDQKTLVRQVNVFNRGEDNEWRLRDVEIRVGDIDVSTVPLNQVITWNNLCNQVSNDYVRQGWNRFPCPPKSAGRFLTIQIVKFCNHWRACVYDRKNTLSLCEVQVLGIYEKSEPTVVYQNVAMFKNATVSSDILLGLSAAARFLTDDFLLCHSEHPLFGCAFTSDHAVEKYPWVQIHLDIEYPVASVTLYSPKNAKFRLHDIRIRIGNEDASITTTVRNQIIDKNTQCVEAFNEKDAPSTEVYLPCVSTINGIFVTIQMFATCNIHSCPASEDRVRMELSEVCVWSPISTPDSTAKELHSPGVATNVALFKRTAQSTYQASSFFAVDGVVPSVVEECAMTQSQLHPWWRVDLGVRYFVDRINLVVVDINERPEEGVLPTIFLRVGGVDIHNLNSDEEFLSNELCGSMSLTESSSKHQNASVTCQKPLRGQYASVQRGVECPEGEACVPERSNLVLCEVEIFGIVDFVDSSDQSDRLPLDEL